MVTQNLGGTRPNFRQWLEGVPPLWLVLRWGKTGRARVAYEEGDDVIQDSQDISKILGKSADQGLANINRRIRVNFGDDPDREYTNQFVMLMAFLGSIEGAVVFDPQQNDVVKLRK